MDRIDKKNNIYRSNKSLEPLKALEGNIKKQSKVKAEEWINIDIHGPR